MNYKIKEMDKIMELKFVKKVTTLVEYKKEQKLKIVVKEKFILIKK